MSAVAACAPCQIPSGLILHAGMDPTFVAKFCLFTAMLLLGAVAVAKILKLFFRLPTIAGQIIGGLFLGPSFIDIAHSPLFAAPIRLMDFGTGQTYSVISSDLFVFFILLISSALTVSYLLWVAGHETEVKDIVKIGVTAVSAGFFGAMIPIVMVALTTYYGLHGWSLVESISLGLVFAATSVSIPVAMLFAYNKMHLKSSKATLGAAVIDDILAVILLSVFFLLIQSGFFGTCHVVANDGHCTGLTEALAYMVASFTVILSIGYFLIPPLISWMRKSHYAHLITLVATATMLLYFSFSELVGGLAGITGAYFAGLFHRMGDKNHHAEKTIAPFVNAVLLPLFLASIGLQINIRVLDRNDWKVVVVLLVVAIASKMIGCWLATLLSNLFSRNSGTHRWRILETYLFGSSMVARGEVGLVISTILFGSQVLTMHQYVIAVIVIVLTTIASPVMLSLGFAYLKSSPTKVEEGDDYILNLGTFPVVGTEQMFNIIIGLLEASGQYKTSVRLGEERKIVNVQGKRVKIILCPEDGVILEGNSRHIAAIVDLIKKSVGRDLQRLTVS